MNRHTDPNQHWFSSVHLADFHKRTFPLYTRYAFMLATMVFSLLLLLGEIYICVALLLYKNWVPGVFQVGLIESNTPSTTPTATSTSPVVTDMLHRVGSSAGWIVVGSTGLSVCVLIWDWVQAWSLVESDSIPGAFLNSTAFQLWSIKSYSHFCLLSRIQWGRGLRQRAAMAVYFGLQGFVTVLVALPRLALYGCILLAVRTAPGFALSASGFQWLRTAGYTQLQGGLLAGALVIMAISALFHALYLIKILAASLACLCSLCCLGRLRSSMSKELHSRISALVQSTSQRNNRRCSNFQNERKQEVSDNAMSQGHSSTISMPEKTVATTILNNQSHIGRQPNSQEEFHDVSLDIDHTYRREHQRNRGHQRLDQPMPTPTLSVFPPTDDIVPMVNMSALSSRIDLSHTQAAMESSNAPSPLPPFTHPSMATTDISGSRNLSSFNPPLNRLAALSFYDDLLKSINSERMMYATSYSNPSRSQEQLMHDGQLHNKKVSIDSQSPSIALCSSIPLTYSTGSEIDDRLSSDQPIHPFDTTPTSQPQETLIPRTQSSERLQQENNGNMERVYIHPMDIMSLNGGLEINLTPQQESHHSRDRSSKCSSSHSQETIENWRIHVAPSSPTIPAIDHDMEDDMCATPTPIPRKNGPHVLQLTPTDKNGYLFAKDSCYENKSNHQGSIPIILSAQLQHQAAQYLDDDDLYISAADLHIPRPSYAYGQSRTQRQGSVNSSIGGYNYSTAASSPSLADSLSNPMYHQQSLDMNVSMGSRPFLLRKGSLPSSITSSLIDDGLSRGGPQKHYFQTGLQQSNTMHHPHSQHANFPAIPTRMRTRAPSHLSNMVHGNSMSGHTVKNSAQNTSPQQKRRSHYRSHSHHVRSSSSHNTDSQWGSFGEFKEAQTGFTTMIDIPPTSMSHIDYQPQENDTVVRSGVSKANMSLQEALAIDEQQFRATGFHENTNQYRASRGPYRGPNVPDHLVHPLDLSPLLSHSQGGHLDYNYQNQHHMQSQQQHMAATSNAQTWNDACVGLGLIMNNNSQFQQQHQHIDQSNTQYYDPTPSEQGHSQQPNPIPLQRERIQSHTPSNDYDDPMTYLPPPSPSAYPEHHYHRPDMVSRMTSNATTLTHHSNRTHTSSYSEATSVTTTNPPTSHSRTVDYDKRHQAYIQGGEPRRSTSQSTHQGFNHLHRQPSQRNKKNLVVAIVPSTVY